MMLNSMRLWTAFICLILVTGACGVSAQDAAEPTRSLDGLWSGAWGGGARDGVVFQPVLAELLILGNHVELCGFRNVTRLAGAVRIDERAKRLSITPNSDSAEPVESKPKPKSIEFAFTLSGETLTLTDSDQVPVTLRRRRTVEKPAGNVQLEFVQAMGINAAGDLLVTDTRVLRASSAGGTYYERQERTLKAAEATAFVVKEAGMTKLSLAEAREHLRTPSLVALTYRHEERPAPYNSSELVQDVGAPLPDSPPALLTLTKLLRPGTLVFILPASEAIPQP